jgi:hypothetical protein
MTTLTDAAAPPPSAMAFAAGPVQACLRAARFRLMAQRLFDALSACVLSGACLLLVFAVVQFLRGIALTHIFPVAIGTAALSVLAALVATALRWPTLARTATLIDRRAGTHDRFHTALKFATAPSPSPFQSLTLTECARYAETFPVRRWTPFQTPRTLRYLAVPLLLGGGLFAYAHYHPYQPPRPTPLDGVVARQADVLKTLADKLQQKSPDTRTPELDKLAEEMKNSARRLQDATARPDEEKLKSALRELSSLEAMLRAMKEVAREQRSSPEEMAALTAALAANQQTRAAADALKAGDPEQAGAQLEKLLQQLKRDGDPSQALQQLAQSMQEQAGKLTEQQKSEVAQQMQQAAQAAQSGQPQLSQKSLERLAELLRKLGANKNGKGQQQQQQKQQASGGKSGAAKPMTEEELQQLIHSLENMKEGLQQPGGDEGQMPGGKDGKPGSRSLSMVESFAKGADNPETNTPAGMPGGGGHNDKIFDDKPVASEPESGAAKHLEGLPGEGESLQELVNTAGDSAKAGRAYRQLYEAAAPAAQDAVEHENIPLGSRRFVRRYFENIRPQN